MDRGRIGRGEVWLYQFPAPNKRRPVLVLSNPLVLSLLDEAIVAPISSTMRGAPTEVLLGIDEGLKHPSSVNLAYVTNVRQADLRHFVGVVAPKKMLEVGRALSIACGCY